MEIESLDCDGFLIKLSTGRKVLLDIGGEVELGIIHDKYSEDGYSEGFRELDYVDVPSVWVEVYALRAGEPDEEQIIDDELEVITGKISKEELEECKETAVNILQGRIYNKAEYYMDMYEG